MLLVLVTYTLFQLGEIQFKTQAGPAVRPHSVIAEIIALLGEIGKGAVLPRPMSS